MKDTFCSYETYDLTSIQQRDRIIPIIRLYVKRKNFKKKKKRCNTHNVIWITLSLFNAIRTHSMRWSTLDGQIITVTMTFGLLRKEKWAEWSRQWTNNGVGTNTSWTGSPLYLYTPLFRFASLSSHNTKEREFNRRMRSINDFLRKSFHASLEINLFVKKSLLHRNGRETSDD